MDEYGHILVDSDEYTSETDSAFASIGPSDAPSIASAINSYRFENGRRYHSYSEGLYYAPNDEQQNEHLDIFHHIYTLLLDGELTLAPIESPKRVLDLGTGTGIWVMDFADKYPESHCIGNDLSPTQPSWVPPNVEFEVDDFTKDWVHPPNSFSFIHARALYGAVPDWKRLYQETYDALQPGGYFEHIESEIMIKCDDGQVPDPCRMYELCHWLETAASTNGTPFNVTDHIGSYYKDTGFVDIHHVIHKAPIGTWAKSPKLKNVGLFNVANILQGIDGMCLQLFHKVLGWPHDKIQELIAAGKHEIQDRRNHFYYRTHFFYGRKPTIEEQENVS